MSDNFQTGFLIIGTVEARETRGKSSHGPALLVNRGRCSVLPLEQEHAGPAETTIAPPIRGRPGSSFGIKTVCDMKKLLRREWPRLLHIGILMAVLGVMLQVAQRTQKGLEAKETVKSEEVSCLN